MMFRFALKQGFPYICDDYYPFASEKKDITFSDCLLCRFKMVKELNLHLVVEELFFLFHIVLFSEFYNAVVFERT